MLKIILSIAVYDENDLYKENIMRNRKSVNEMQTVKESDGSEIYINTIMKLANKMAPEIEKLKDLDIQKVDRSQLKKQLDYYDGNLTGYLESFSILENPNKKVLEDKQRIEELLKQVKLCESVLSKNKPLNRFISFFDCFKKNNSQELEAGTVPRLKKN